MRHYGGYSTEVSIEDSQQIEVAVKYHWDFDKEEWASSQMRVQYKDRPFQKGSMRYAYLIKDVATGIKYVAKAYFNKKRHGLTDDMYFQDVKMQAYAQVWAEKFNRRDPPKKINFVPTFVLRLTERKGAPLYSCEPFLDGKFRKYNNNFGHVTDKKRNTPQAFSHFSYEVSKQELMVVDIQGVGDSYTDPQIHTVSGLDFGAGNKGVKGMKRFLGSHRCNAVCTALKLPVNDPLAVNRKLRGSKGKKKRRRERERVHEAREREARARERERLRVVTATSSSST
jgi:elongation factor 2 kinase